MKKAILLILFMGAILAYSQNTYKYWVQFKDKDGTPYNVDYPENYLSQRALERRARYHIAIDTLDLPVNPNYLEAITDRGFRVRNVSKWVNGAVVDAVDTSRIGEIRELTFVKNVILYEKPKIYQLPDDGYSSSLFTREFHTQLYTNKFYNAGYHQIEQLNGILLHKAGYHGEGMLIGVCDAGFPGVDTIDCLSIMREQGRLVGSRDFVFPGETVFNDHPHGTMVLSTMASYDPGMYVGTAYKASYVLCKTENPYSETPLEEYYWIEAAEYLDSLGADMITTSLGYFTFDDQSMTLSMGELDGKTRDMSIAANIAFSRGMLILNAAGNEGNVYPPHLNTPADAEWVLTVGAVDYHGNCASFSSPGPTADGRIKPDVAALGVSVAVALPTGSFMVGNGTSFATPIMAGMMACAWQRLRQHTPQQMCDSVRSWGNCAGHPNNFVGYGIPDFGNALRTVPDPIGVVQVEEEQRVLLFPNPSRGRTSLVVEDDDTQVLVYNSIGGIEYKGLANDSQTQDFLSNLRPGFYLVQLLSPTGNKTIKYIRN